MRKYGIWNKQGFPPQIQRADLTTVHINHSAFSLQSVLSTSLVWSTRRQLSALQTMEMPLDGVKYGWLLNLQTLVWTGNGKRQKQFSYQNIKSHILYHQSERHWGNEPLQILAVILRNLIFVFKSNMRLVLDCTENIIWYVILLGKFNSCKIRNDYFCTCPE